MKIIIIKACFVCPFSKAYQDLKVTGMKVIVYCCYAGEDALTNMGVEGIWDKCPLEDYENIKNN